MKAVAIKRFVVDASMALALYFADEASRESAAVLDILENGATAVAPAFWLLEVANALLMAERRGRLSLAQSSVILQDLVDLQVVLAPDQIHHAWGQTLSLARREELTEYDAAYLELALRESLPLATFDRKLRTAARRAGITLVVG